MSRDWKLFGWGASCGLGAAAGSEHIWIGFALFCAIGVAFRVWAEYGQEKPRG